MLFLCWKALLHIANIEQKNQENTFTLSKLYKNRHFFTQWHFFYAMTLVFLRNDTWFYAMTLVVYVIQSFSVISHLVILKNESVKFRLYNYILKIYIYIESLTRYFFLKMTKWLMTDNDQLLKKIKNTHNARYRMIAICKRRNFAT